MKESIQSMIDYSDSYLYAAMRKVYSYQTEEEKFEGDTWESNGKGFSGYDAQFASSLITGRDGNGGLEKFGKLTKNQLPYARKMMKKYWRQIAEESAENPEKHLKLYRKLCPAKRSEPVVLDTSSFSYA